MVAGEPLFSGGPASPAQAIRDATSELTAPRRVTIVEEAVTDDPPTKILGLAWTDLKSRVRETRGKLREAQKNGCLLTLNDSDGDFDDLIISRMSTIRALEDGDGATFQLKAQRIRLTTVQEVDAPQPAELRGQKPKALGSQSIKEADEEKKETLKSSAASLDDGST